MTSKTASQLAISLITSICIQGLYIISGVITARLLGPEGKGQLTAVIIWPGLLVTFGLLGMSDAITYFVAENSGREPEILGTALAFGFLQALVLMAGGYVVLPYALKAFGNSTVEIGLVYLWWIPLNIGTQYGASALAGRLHLLPYNLVRVSVVVASVLGLIAVLVLGNVSVLSVAESYLVANIIALLVALLACWRYGWLGFFFNGELLRRMLSYGMKAQSSNVLSLFNQRGDQLLISLFLPPDSLGLYVIAVTLTAATGLLGTSVSIVAMPIVANAADLHERLSLLARLVRATVLVSTVFVIGMALLVPYVIHFFFGPAFLPAIDVARVLLVASIALCANQVLGSGLKGLGHPLAAGVAELIAVGVTAVSLACLLPYLGIMGAGVASLLAYGTSLAYMAWYVRRRFEVSPQEMLIPRKADVVWLGDRAWNSISATGWLGAYRPVKGQRQ